MDYSGQALGYIEGNIFSGQFQAEYEAHVPNVPLFSLNMCGLGNFTVVLEHD